MICGGGLAVKLSWKPGTTASFFYALLSITVLSRVLATVSALIEDVTPLLPLRVASVDRHQPGSRHRRVIGLRMAARNSFDMSLPFLGVSLVKEDP
jgi:hypothetical protein